MHLQLTCDWLARVWEENKALINFASTFLMGRKQRVWQTSMFQFRSNKQKQVFQIICFRLWIDNSGETFLWAHRATFSSNLLHSSFKGLMWKVSGRIVLWMMSGVSMCFSLKQLTIEKSKWKVFCLPFWYRWRFAFNSYFKLSTRLKFMKHLKHRSGRMSRQTLLQRQSFLHHLIIIGWVRKGFESAIKIDCSIKRT